MSADKGAVLYSEAVFQYLFSAIGDKYFLIRISDCIFACAILIQIYYEICLDEYLQVFAVNIRICVVAGDKMHHTLCDILISADRLKNFLCDTGTELLLYLAVISAVEPFALVNAYICLLYTSPSPRD